MEVKFFISGGSIEIERQLFAKAMLMKNHLIRTIIYGVDQGKNLKNPPIINKVDGSWVSIEYNKADDVVLDFSVYELFKALKDQYKDKIRGIVTIKMVSYSTNFFMFDLNAPDKVIKI